MTGLLCNRNHNKTKTNNVTAYGQITVTFCYINVTVYHNYNL